MGHINAYKMVKLMTIDKNITTDAKENIYYYDKKAPS